MSTVQVWANDDDRDKLSRLKAFFEHKQEEEFGNRAYMMSTGMRKKRIRRTKINESHIYRKALNWFWLHNERRVVEFEKAEKPKRRVKEYEPRERHR